MMDQVALPIAVFTLASAVSCRILCNGIRKFALWHVDEGDGELHQVTNYLEYFTSQHTLADVSVICLQLNK
jgi:hypothetical protein